jgi:plastocyanin
MTLTRIIAGLLVLAAVSFGLIACGDDDDEDTGGDQTLAATTAAPDGGDETPAATSPGAGNDNTPPAAGGGNSVDVKTEGFAFNPTEITVPAGEPITFNFTNADSAPHTFTLYVDEKFTQAIDGGSASEDTPEITVAFVAPGEYYFRCEVHPSQMQGELVAE